MTDNPTYEYADGSPVLLGDLCLIGRESGIWQVYHLGTFTPHPRAQIQRPERRYASLQSTRGPARRTAADLHELRLCARSAL